MTISREKLWVLWRERRRAHDSHSFYLHRLIWKTLLERFSLIDLLGLKEAKLPKVRDKM